MTALVRRAAALVLSLAVVVAPWPAWGQTARVAVPLSSSGSSAAGASVIRPLPGAPSGLSGPSLLSLSAPSLRLSGAPVPRELAASAVPAARAVPAALRAATPAAMAPSVAVKAVPEAAAAPSPGLAVVRPGSARFSGAGLDEAVRSHAVDRGFEFGSNASAGTLGAGAARLPAASVSRPGPRAGPPAAKGRIRLLPAASSLWLILGNVALIQLGVEAMSLAVPQYALGVFGYGAMAAVSAASSIALAAGSLLGSWSSDKLGPERTYIGTLGARAAVAATLAGLYATGLLPAAALVGLFAADFLLHYMNTVSLDALAPRWLGEDAARLNRFGVRRQIGIDAAGLLGPLGAGAAIALWSYGSVFWVYPAIFALSTVGGLIALRRLSTGFAVARRSLIKADGWRETLRAVAATPALRWSVLGFALVTVVMMSLYFLAGPAFGAAAAAVSGGSAAQITSVMTGLFAGGGVLGSLLQLRLTRGLKTPGALQRQMGWSLAAFGLAVLSFWALLATAPIAVFSVFGFVVPLYAVQLLMIPLGAAWAIPTVGLVTILQSRTAAGAKAKVAGINRFLAMFASFVFSLALGGLFSGLVGASGFVALAGIMSAFAAAAVVVGWRLARSGREAGPR